jgi:hypothetical protein
MHESFFMRATTRSGHPLDSAALTLIRAEETIALVERATPTNAQLEIQRLSAVGPRGGRLLPAFVYESLPELSGVRRGLERVAREVSAHGRLGALHAARAEELELEACLVERIGTPAFSALAAERFRVPSGELAGQVTTFVEAALVATEPTAMRDIELFASDDRGSRASLVSELTRRAAELALPLRVEIRPRQLAIAATGHGVVAIRPGVPLSAETAARIALHELLAHALPRARSAHAPLLLLRAGTAGSIESEEGRALLVEARAGKLGPARRRELALRHVAALSVRSGADFEETFRALAARGAERPRALEIAVRIHRGGGLAREIAYLPAYHEVARAFAEDAELERWFERGRVSLGAARDLVAHEQREQRASHSSNSMNTGV